MHILWNLGDVYVFLAALCLASILCEVDSWYFVLACSEPVSTPLAGLAVTGYNPWGLQHALQLIHWFIGPPQSLQ